MMVPGSFSGKYSFLQLSLRERAARLLERGIPFLLSFSLLFRVARLRAADYMITSARPGREK